MIRALGRTERDGVRFHLTTQNGARFTTQIVYFWNFPFNTFGPRSTETTASEMADKGETMHFSESSGLRDRTSRLSLYCRAVAHSATAGPPDAPAPQTRRSHCVIPAEPARPPLGLSCLTWKVGTTMAPRLRAAVRTSQDKAGGGPKGSSCHVTSLHYTVPTKNST